MGQSFPGMVSRTGFIEIMRNTVLKAALYRFLTRNEFLFLHRLLLGNILLPLFLFSSP